MCAFNLVDNMYDILKAMLPRRKVRKIFNIKIFFPQESLSNYLLIIQWKKYNRRFEQEYNHSPFGNEEELGIWVGESLRDAAQKYTPVGTMDTKKNGK